jgi:hypothetical protein
VKTLNAIGFDGDAYLVEVYYTGKGLAFTIDSQGKAVDEIRRDTGVWNVWYFPPGDMLSYFTTYSCCSADDYEGAVANARVHLENVRPWPGFGKVTPIITRGR